MKKQAIKREKAGVDLRRRIQQLARGKFEHLKPSLSISVDKIDITAMEGNDVSGDFVITSTNHVPMRGIVYSSNPRMECLTPQFEGEEIRIRYQFHSYGLVEGDIQKGEFCIVVEQGEYNLSFVVSISRLYADSSICFILENLKIYFIPVKKEKCFCMRDCQKELPPVKR